MGENIIDCECNDFKLSWPQIIAAQCFVATHGGDYTGEKIRFCPWCGKRFLTQHWSVSGGCLKCGCAMANSHYEYCAEINPPAA